MQVYPKPSDRAQMPLETFVQTAKTEYAYQFLLLYWKQRREEGEFEIPGYLLSEESLDVKNDEMDISGLKIFHSLPSDQWLKNIGGINCDCQYIKSSVNQAQVFNGDDTPDDSIRTYYAIKNKIIFPQGVHKSPLSIIYANMGGSIDGKVQVDDAIAGIVRERLIEMYLGKIGKEDKTNNSNSND